MEVHGQLYWPDILYWRDIDLLAHFDLFWKTKGFVCAIVDEFKKMNNYRKYMIKGGTVEICKDCHQSGESIKHIIFSCSHLINGETLHRHDQVSMVIINNLLFKF